MLLLPRGIPVRCGSRYRLHPWACHQVPGRAQPSRVTLAQKVPYVGRQPSPAQFRLPARSDPYRRFGYRRYLPDSPGDRRFRDNFAGFHSIVQLPAGPHPSHRKRWRWFFPKSRGSFFQRPNRAAPVLCNRALYLFQRRCQPGSGQKPR